jgi:hypothetical protein
LTTEKISVSLNCQDNLTEINMKLEKFGIWFKGPHSEELFKALYVPPSGFDQIFVGTGESKAVAAARALSHTRGCGLSGIYDELEKLTHRNMPPRSTAIEGDDYCQVYCIIGVGVNESR